MSRLVARILLSIMMFPVAVVIYVSILMNFDRLGRWNGNYYFSESIILLTAGAGAWIFIVIYLTLLWRKSVRWTTRRILAPIAAALLGILVISLAEWFLSESGDWEGKIVLLDILIPSLWLMATVHIWRETPAERASRLGASGRNSISCPTCGYNLTGLTEARCPECGTKFTLDELMAAQAHQLVGEIE